MLLHFILLMTLVTKTGGGGVNQSKALLLLEHRKALSVLFSSVYVSCQFATLSQIW